MSNNELSRIIVWNYEDIPYEKESISIVDKIRIYFKKVAQERMTAVYRVILK
jgi:hypothetical protein